MFLLAYTAEKLIVFPKSTCLSFLDFWGKTQLEYVVDAKCQNLLANCFRKIDLEAQKQVCNQLKDKKNVYLKTLLIFL